MRTYILNAIEDTIRMRPNKWVLSSELQDDVSKRTNKILSPRSIGRYLKQLVDDRKVKRRRRNPLHSLYEYQSLLPPNCCAYGKFIANDKHCLVCGAEYK